MARIPRNFSNKVTPSLIKTQYDTTPQNIGGDVAQALQEQAAVIGQKMQEFAREQEAARTLDYSINGALQFQNEAISSFEKAKQEAAGTDGKGFTQNIMQQFDTVAEGILAQAPNQEAALRMKAKLGSFKLQMQGQAFKYETELSQRHALENVDNTINSFSNLVLQNPAEYDKANAQLDETFKLLQQKGIDITKIQYKASQELLKNKVLGEMQKDPTKTYTDLLEGKYNQLDNSTYISLTQKAAKVQADMIKQQKTLLTAKVNRLIVDSGTPIDPTDKNAVNALNSIYKERLLEHSQNLQDALNFSVDFVKTHNSILPKQLKSAIEVNLTAGKPEDKVAYAKVVKELATDPSTQHLIKSISKDTVAKATALNKLVDSGLSPEVANDKVSEMFKPIPDDVKKTREEIIKQEKLLNLDDVRSTIADEFGTDQGSEAAVQDYRRVYTEIFTKTGDADVADEVARKELRRVYATTSVNGTEEIMPNAPEQLYPDHIEDFKAKLTEEIAKLEKKSIPQTNPNYQSDLSTAIDMNDDIGGPAIPPSKEFVEGIKKNVQEAITPTFPEIRIRSDYQTEKDGSYALTKINEFGVEVPIIDKETGNMLRYRYTPGKTELEDKVTKTIEEAKKERDAINEVAKQVKTKSLEEAKKIAQQKGLTPPEEHSLWWALKKTWEAIAK